jgi:hypothetical protein
MQNGLAKYNMKYRDVHERNGINIEVQGSFPGFAYVSSRGSKSAHSKAVRKELIMTVIYLTVL